MHWCPKYLQDATACDKRSAGICRLARSHCIPDVFAGDVFNATYSQPVPERKTAKDNEIRSESASEQPTQKKQKQKDTESECNAQAEAAAASLGEGACHLFHMS